MEGLLVTREPQWKIQNSLTSTGLLSISSPASLLQAAPSHTVNSAEFWVSGKNGALGMTLICLLENKK